MSIPTPAVASFVVTGMHCASCGMLIDEAVEELVGVVSSATSVRRSRTVVTYDPAQSSPAAIAAAIAAAGSYQADLDGSGGAST
ncbi:MAG: cation transporter [Acidimicrobiales bacterium]